MKTLRILIISLLLFGCGIVPGIATATPTPEPTQTATATATSTPSVTPTADMARTQIAIVGLTQTQQVAKALATRTAQANKAASILDEIKAALGQAEGIADIDAKLVFGPVKGSLAHELDNSVQTFDPELSLKNFITSITFVNPYETSTMGTWDYGILFRNEYSNNQYRLTLLSNRSWTLVDASSWTDIFGKNDKLIRAKAGEENTIWLVVIDTKSYLFINKTYTQTLDVSGKLTAGDISPATGLYAGNEKARKTTKFYDFLVWSLP